MSIEAALRLTAAPGWMIVKPRDLDFDVKAFRALKTPKNGFAYFNGRILSIGWIDSGGDMESHDVEVTKGDSLTPNLMKTLIHQSGGRLAMLTPEQIAYLVTGFRGPRI